MKTTLMRVLVIAMLASSISAFAKTDEKREGAPAPRNVAQKSDSKQKVKDSSKQEKSKKSPREDQQEKDFDRVLMGIYG